MQVVQKLLFFFPKYAKSVKFLSRQKKKEVVFEPIFDALPADLLLTSCVSHIHTHTHTHTHTNNTHPGITLETPALASFYDRNLTVVDSFGAKFFFFILYQRDTAICLETKPFIHLKDRKLLVRGCFALFH